MFGGAYFGETYPGGAPVFFAAYTLTAAAGAVAQTGNSATLRVTRRVVASGGARTVTGNAAALTITRRIGAGVGSVTVTGNAAALLRARVPLTAGAGTFTLTGKTAALSRTRSLRAGAGTFNLSGQSVALTPSNPPAATSASGGGGLFSFFRRRRSRFAAPERQQIRGSARLVAKAGICRGRGTVTPPAPDDSDALALVGVFDALDARDHVALVRNLEIVDRKSRSRK